jgi:hypothetical protein
LGAGKKFGDCLSVPIAEKIGAAFAKMHLLGIERQAGRPYSNEQIIEFKVNVPALLEFCYDRPDDLRATRCSPSVSSTRCYGYGMPTFRSAFAIAIFTRATSTSLRTGKSCCSTSTAPASIF